MDAGLFVDREDIPIDDIDDDDLEEETAEPEDAGTKAELH